jgi:predicted transcriptional regulator
LKTGQRKTAANLLACFVTHLATVKRQPHFYKLIEISKDLILISRVCDLIKHRSLIIPSAIILLLILGLCTSTNVNAAPDDDLNSSITGSVTDIDNSTPIAGANVTVHYLDQEYEPKTNKTDSNGHYELTNLSAGNVTITASAEFYHDSSVNITIIENQTMQLNFTLKALDSDSDSAPDIDDAFPFNPDETMDTDGDGVGDNSDAYPEDPTKSQKKAPDDGGGSDGDDKDATETLMGEDANSICLLIIIIAVIIVPILGVAVYTRLKSRRLLEHQTRERIYTHVQANPGVHYRGIMNELSLSMGVLTHHLNMLERQGYIKSMQDGNFRRFYSKDQTVDTQLLLTQPQESILSAIKSNPGISQSKLASELNMTKKTVYYNVNQLKDSGLIHVDRSGRESECFIAGET